MRVSLLVAAAILASAATFLWDGREPMPESTPAPGPVSAATSQWRQQISVHFAGDQACAECHAEQFAAHQRSGHSHTAILMAQSPLARQLDGTTFHDPQRNRDFKFLITNDRFLVKQAANSTQSDDVELAVDWLLGSGAHAQTAVAVDERRQVGAELRWTWFAHTGQLGLTPDHERFTDYRPSSLECFGRPLDTQGVLRCLGCHMTFGPPAGVSLTADNFQPNISCERCHGPRKQHAQLAHAGRADVVSPLVKFNDAETYVSMCAQCHRDETNISAEMPAKELPRFQPLGLKKSRCYQESPQKMNCSACHDPHDSTSVDQAHYTAACRNCHSSGKDSVCAVNSVDKCVNCHMPAVEWSSGIVFHDHWIRIPDNHRP